MRLAIVLILGFVLFVSCEANRTEQFEETIRLDTLRNHSDSNYDILITESFNTQETGSSEGPKAVKFLNKELKEVLKVSLETFSCLSRILKFHQRLFQLILQLLMI
jgi:hypothetical protein